MMLAKIFRELEGGEKKNQVMTMTQMTFLNSSGLSMSIYPKFIQTMYIQNVSNFIQNLTRQNKDIIFLWTGRRRIEESDDDFPNLLMHVHVNFSNFYPNV